MKVSDLFESSKGHQVMDFSKWLQSGATPKKRTADIEHIGTLLFGKGFAFTTDPTPRFSKGHITIILESGRKGSIPGVTVVYRDMSVTPMDFAIDFYFMKDLQDDGILDAIQKTTHKATT